MKQSKKDNLRKKLLWLNVRLFTIAGGLLCGGGLFLATNWLVIKDGDRVGPHLTLLNQFFWGYSVTFKGSIVGFFYGLLVGGVFAGLVAYIYNKLLDLDGVNQKPPAV